MQADVKNRPGRKFPFKARTIRERDETSKKVSVALVGVENMIYDLARDILPAGTGDDDIQESVQVCMIHLWQKSMPKYNAWKGVKISTFLHTCISNFMKQERRKMSRQRAIHMVLSQIRVEEREKLTAGDTSLDDRIEAMANSIVADPSQYLTPVQVTVFNALVDNPEIMMKTLAEDLSYARASSLSMIKRRIRQRLLEVDIENFFATPDEGLANPTGRGRPAIRAGRASTQPVPRSAEKDQ